MLNILGRKTQYCDGVSRRSFLKIGGLSAGAVGGLSLADLMRARLFVCVAWAGREVGVWRVRVVR